MPATAVRSEIAHRYDKEFAGSKRLFERARQAFPSGVTHDLRIMDPFPVFIDRAKGSHKWDVDGRELIDYWSGHGALLLGHCPDDVTAAVREWSGRLTHAGGCHELEIQWAEWVKKLIPSAEKVRFTASGTEATLMALRLARMATGKPKVLKFVGHFHGWHDFVMPSAYGPYDGSAVPGIPDPVSVNTVVVLPNQPDLVEQALKSDDQIGAVIIEPTGGHWGKVPVRGEFIHALRDLTTKFNRLFIMDEVITGFRVSPGGAQSQFDVKPDLTTLAKILAGGLPGGAVAGRKDLLDQIEVRPGKPKMRHPGTYNGNPVCAAAGVTALKRVATGQPTTKANDAAVELRRRFNELFAKRDWPWVSYGDYSLVHLLPDYHGPRPTTDDFVPHNGAVEKLDGDKNAKRTFAFRQAMLLNGVDLPGFGMFLTACHDTADIVKTVQAVGQAIEMLQADGF